jgi:TatD DNase family protein
MFDTHLHLDLLGDAGPASLAAAALRGVTHLCAIGVDPRVPASLQGAAPAGVVVVRALGLHPQEVKDAADVDAALAALDERLRHRADDVVAVGECGLDARPGIGDPALHERAFRAQLLLARRHALPVVLHGVRRDAAMLQALDDEYGDDARTGRVRGVWHGFSSSTDTMKHAVRRGLSISVGFLVLNEKARRLREAVPHIPLERLVVETDAPPLPPERLVDVVDEVARLRGVSRDEIARATTANARALFGV